MTLAKKPASWLFVAAAALIYSVVYLVVRAPQAISHTALVSAAALFDLCVTTPLVCYALLTRNGYYSRLTVAAVSLAGFRAAGFLLPDVDRQYLPSLGWISALLELVFVAALVRRFRRVRSGGDMLTRIRSAASAVIPYSLLANVVAAEAAVLYYALFSWKAKPEESRNGQTFSCAEASGYRFFGTLLMLLILAEGVPLHFLLSRYSASAAWILTGVDAYGLLWAVAIIRAVQLRRIVVDEQSVKIRVGMVWEAEIRRENIVSCRRVNPAMASEKTPGYLKTVVLNDPQYILQLNHPAVAVGFYGQRRMFTQIGIAVDKGEAFVSALDCGIFS